MPPSARCLTSSAASRARRARRSLPAQQPRHHDQPQEFQQRELGCSRAVTAGLPIDPHGRARVEQDAGQEPLPVLHRV
eukprot:6554043-Prymnesium_polylepis.1